MMKKRILTVLLAVFLLLPMVSLPNAKAAALPMPDMEKITSFYDNSDFVVAVLNEHGELWLYYTEKEYDANGKVTATHLPQKTRCVTTGAKAFTVVHYGIFVLKENGNLECYSVYLGDIKLQGTVLTGIEDVAEYGVYRLLALDKAGNVHYIDTGWNGKVTTDIRIIDSGADNVFPGGEYLKDGVLMSHLHTEPYHEVAEDGLPAGVASYWSEGGTTYVLTRDGVLWGWGRNHVGQLACGEYDQIGPYFYVGSYTANYTSILLNCKHPVKITGGVERIWIDDCQVFAQMKDGTYRTWGDGEPIMAMVDATSGKLDIGPWDYPKGWPNIPGWVIRKTTVSQWKGEINYFDTLFKNDGTIWMDFDSNDETNPYVYVGVWSNSTPKPIFSDVPLNYYCDEPVRWAVKEGVTNGTSNTTFSPNQTCTQAQILTFLWRAAGQPESGIENPYSHRAMTSNQYFYKAMLWAWDAGLIGDADLDPNAPCRRSDVVTYLWKLDGSPRTKAGSTFTDVPKNEDYASAVQWAVDKAITNGTSETTFGPAETCTRGQIVTFLYRYFVGE